MSTLAEFGGPKLRNFGGPTLGDFGREILVIAALLFAADQPKTAMLLLDMARAVVALSDKAQATASLNNSFAILRLSDRLKTEVLISERLGP